MQYIEFSEAVKIENFQKKCFDNFLIFDQNIDCGCSINDVSTIIKHRVECERPCRARAYMPSQVFDKIQDTRYKKFYLTSVLNNK